MADLDAVRKLYKWKKLRTPAAKQFDRNCVLAMTAGQLIAASLQRIPVKAIVVGESTFEVGPVAKDIVLKGKPLGFAPSLIATTGVVAFFAAAGIVRKQEEDEKTESVFKTAELLLAPSIEDGSMARLVVALDQLKIAGERSYG